MSGHESVSTTLNRRGNWTFGLPRSLHALGVNLVLLPLGIVTSVVIARAVGPAGKGSLDLLVATAALLTTVLSLSLPQGNTYVIAQRKVSPGVLAFQLFFISLLQAVIALGILILIQRSGYAHKFLPDWGSWVIVALVGYVWIELLNKYWGSILTGQQQIASVNNAELVGRISQFLIVFILAGGLYLYGKQLSVALLFLVALSASILINVFLVTSLDFKFEPSRDARGLRAAIDFALPCYAANTAQFLNYKFDVFVVGLFLGTTSVGRYTLAVSLGQLLWLVSNSAASVLLAKVAGAANVRDTVSHTAQVTRLAFWATALGAVVLALVATQAIPFLYGEAFRPSIVALFWLLPGIGVFSIANVLAAYLAGIGKPHLNFWVSGTSLIVTIALDFLLIPKWNIVGASIASTVSYFVSALMLVVFFTRETGTPARQVLLMTAEDVRLVRSLARFPQRPLSNPRAP